ncbi:MAG: hypothetical protein FJ118_14660 [Deltaproteobacteria bacterium]|nr:hypothetical protein [Deltaproteobacteria bacterium]
MAKEKPGRKFGKSQDRAMHETHCDDVAALLLREGSEALSEADMLWLLLSYALPADQVATMPEKLLDDFGSLQGVLGASAVELTEQAGIPRRVAVLLRLAGEIVKRGAEPGKLCSEILTDPRALQRRLTEKFRGVRDEQLLVILLDDLGTVLGEEFIGAGTVDQVVAFPRQIITIALRYNASALFLVHNHPHGPPLPTFRDREEAERLREALQPFNIVVRDSIVVGHNRCFSIFLNRPL